MKTIIKSGVYISILTLLSFPISFAIRYLLSNQLTLADFGLFYALISFFDMIQTFNDFGFSEAQAYFIPKYLEKKRFDKVRATIVVQLINQIVTTTLISAAILFGADWIAETIFHYPQAANVVRLFVMYFLFKDFLLNIKNIFYSFQEAHIYGIQEILRVVYTIVLLVLGVKFIDMNLENIAWIWIIVHGTMMVGYFVYFLVKHPEVLRAKHYSLKEIYKEFFPILFPIFISSNMAIFFSTGTETLLAFFKSVTDVGLYNIAKPIANLSMALAVPLSNLLKPYVSQVEERQDRDHISVLVTMIMNIGTFLLLPFIITIIFYSKESIVLLFGEKYSEASNIVKLISVEVFLLIMTNFIYSIISGLGLQKKRAIIIFISSLVSLLLSVTLIPAFGAVGLASANIGYSLVATIGGLIIIYQKIPYSLSIAHYGKVFFLCILFVISQLLFKNISSEASIVQLFLFFGKVSAGMMLYFIIGIFVFKIIKPKLISQGLNSLMNLFPSFQKLLVKDKS